MDNEEVVKNVRMLQMGADSANLRIHQLDRRLSVKETQLIYLESSIERALRLFYWSPLISASIGAIVAIGVYSWAEVIKLSRLAQQALTVLWASIGIGG